MAKSKNKSGDKLDVFVKSQLKDVEAKKKKYENLSKRLEVVKKKIKDADLKNKKVADEIGCDPATLSQCFAGVLKYLTPSMLTRLELYCNENEL